MSGVARIASAQDVDFWADRATVPVERRFFPLRDVRLKGGLLGEQQELNRKYLLKLEPDRLLSWFRREAGLEPKAPPYRGWESEGRPLPGHILGFYLSGASMTVEATGDATLRERIEYILGELEAVQAANGNGYMLAVPGGKKVFADIAAGNIRIGGLPWTGYEINGNFEPTYTLNKLMLGLREAYVATGDERARKILVRLADWFGGAVLEKLGDGQVQALLDCEHGSLNESFADVYVLTGEEKYKTWARRLCHRRMLDPLAKGEVGFLTRYHANTQIPKFTGFERVEALTGEAELDRAAANFWGDVVAHRSWVIGGNSAEEHFFPPEEYGRALHAQAGPESCNSVNMLRLTEALYVRHPSSRLMDYYERALINHLIPAHDPERGTSCYYISMRPGAYRVYSDEFDSMWCCTGTGMEVPGKYGQAIYSRSAADDALDVNLFAASEVRWRSRGVALAQTTDFPREAGTTLTISEAPPEGARFAVRLRRPAWLAGDMGIAVNGEAAKGSVEADGYVLVEREWRKGDVLRVGLPMRLSAEALPGDDHYVALMCGPVVLSGELGRSGGLAKLDFWQIRDTVATKVVPEKSVPTLVAGSVEEVLGKVRPVAGEPLTFETVGLARPGETRLIPFFANHFQRYAIYWRRLSGAEWEAERRAEADRAAAKAAVDARTVDRVRVGEEASEREHHLQGTTTETGPAPGEDPDLPRWRDARNGGWFSYDLAVDPKSENVLRVTTWGRDGGRREFDVQVEGKTMETFSLSDSGKGEFSRRDIALPSSLSGRGHVSVRFQAHPGNSAGGIFDVRVLRAEGK